MQPSLSAQLSQRMSRSLGLQPGQSVIDYHDETENIPNELRAGGTVVEKATGLVVNKYSGDAMAIKLLREYEEIRDSKSDFKFLTQLAGFIHMPPTELVNDDSQWRLQQLSSNIYEVYLADLKKRQIDYSQRLATLDRMLSQQLQQEHVLTHLRNINEAMMPTVARFYWLATITGYPLTPKRPVANQLGELEQPEPESVIPFWLLVRYILPQYTMKNLNPENVRNDKLYWMPLGPRHAWAMDLLERYSEYILTMLTIANTTSIKIMKNFYLFLRDAVLGGNLRLRPPATGPQRGSYFESNDEDVEIGRWYSLANAVDDTQTRVLKVIKRESILSEAITRNDAIYCTSNDTTPANESRLFLVTSEDVNANKKYIDAVTPEDADGIPQFYGFTSAFLNTVFQRKWLERRMRFNEPDVMDIEMGKTLLGDTILDNRHPIHKEYKHWLRELDTITSALGILTVDGLAHWTGWLDLLTLTDRQIIRDAVVSSLNWGTGKRSNDALNILVHVLLFNSPTNAKDTIPQDEISISNIIWPTKTSPTWTIKGDEVDISTINMQTKPNTSWSIAYTPKFTGDPIDGSIWETLESFMKSEKAKFISLVQTTRVWTSTMVNAFEQSRALTLISTMLWAEVLRMPTVFIPIVRILQANLTSHGTTPTPSSDEIEVEWFKSFLTTFPYSKSIDTYVIPAMVAMDRLPHLPAHFFREIIRSTFVQDPDLANVDMRFLEGGGGLFSQIYAAAVGKDRYYDFDPTKRPFDIKDSKNVTVFTKTWEPFYMNIITHSVPGTNEATTFWQKTFQGIVKTAVDAFDTQIKNPTGVSMFNMIWDKLIRNDDVKNLFTMANLPSNGIPPYTSLQLNIPDLPVSASVTASSSSSSSSSSATSSALSNTIDPRQAIQTTQRSFQSTLINLVANVWNLNIVPRQLFQSAQQTSINAPIDGVLSMDLFHAMLAYVLVFFPEQEETIRTNLDALARDIQSADRYVRSAAAADRAFAQRDIQSLLAELDIPDIRWQLQSLFTGRLQMRSYVVAAINQAYSHIQHMARKDADVERAQLSWDQTLNANNKRSWGTMNGFWVREVNAETSFARFLNVPLDVWTANTDPGFEVILDPKTKKPLHDPITKKLIYNNVPTRDYIDETQTDANVVHTLRVDMAAFVAQTLISARLDTPEQYKTVQQYRRAPEQFRSTFIRLRDYTFTSLGDKKWKVERR